MNEHERSDEEYSEAYASHDERVVSKGVIANRPTTLDDRIARVMSGDHRHEVLSSMPMNNRAEKIALYQAQAALGNALPKMALGEPVEVKHFVMCYAQFTDEEGEIKKGVKLVLVDPNDQGHVILSQTFISEFTKLIRLLEPWPQIPPIRISAIETKLQGGRKYYLPKLHT